MRGVHPLIVAVCSAGLLSGINRVSACSGQDAKAVNSGSCGDGPVIASQCQAQNGPPGLPKLACARLMLDLAGSPRFVLQADPGYYQQGTSSISFSFSAASGSAVDSSNVSTFIPHTTSVKSPGSCDVLGECSCTSQCAVQGAPTFTCHCAVGSGTGAHSGIQVELPIGPVKANTSAMKSTFCAQPVVFDDNGAVSFENFGLVQQEASYYLKSQNPDLLQSSRSYASVVSVPNGGAGGVVRLPLKIQSEFGSQPPNCDASCNSSRWASMVGAPALFGFCYDESIVQSVNYFLMPSQGSSSCGGSSIVQQREENVEIIYPPASQGSFQSPKMQSIPRAEQSYKLCGIAGGLVTNSADFFYFEGGGVLPDVNTCAAGAMNTSLNNRIFVEIRFANCGSPCEFAAYQATWLSMPAQICPAQGRYRELLEGDRELWGRSSKGGWA